MDCTRCCARRLIKSDNECEDTKERESDLTLPESLILFVSIRCVLSLTLHVSMQTTGCVEGLTVPSLSTVAGSAARLRAVPASRAHTSARDFYLSVCEIHVLDRPLVLTQL